MIINTSLQVNT